MDIHQLVKAFQPSATGVLLRQGTVVSVQADSTVTVTIGGSSTEVAGVKVAASCCPVPGATCWLATDGLDLFVLATLAPAGIAWGTMRKSTAQTISTATWTALNWTSRTEDVAYGVTLGANGFTVVVPGIYTATGATAFSPDATGHRYARITKNGTAITSAGGVAPSLTARTLAAATMKCAVGDVINLEAYQSSGADLNTAVDGAGNILAVAWIGAA